MRQTKTNFLQDFRRFFWRGLGIVLPTILTLWLLWMAGTFLFTNVAEPINSGIQRAIVRVVPAVLAEGQGPGWAAVSPKQIDEFRAAPENTKFRKADETTIRRRIQTEQFREFWNARWYLDLAGLAFAILLIYLVGVLLSNYLGAQLYEVVEGVLSRVPVFKQVYPSVKQVVDLLLGDRPMAFKRVVLVEYPRTGLWSLGLVANESFRAVGERAGEKCLAVFIPSTPTPFTGFVVHVPLSSVVDVAISVDQAIRFLLTGGLLVPEGKAGEPRAPELRPGVAARIGEHRGSAGPAVTADDARDGHDADGQTERPGRV